MAKRHPTLSGSFLQLGLSLHWDDEAWQRELGFLKEAGITMLIVCPEGENQDGSFTTFYPSQISSLETGYVGTDVMDACLRNCEAAGVRVFVGLSGSDRWWTVYSLYKDWFIGQIALGNSIATELYGRYKSRYPQAFYGWYWVWELFNMPLVSKNFSGRRQQIDLLIEAINLNLMHLTTLDAAMPLMLSPFANDKITALEEHKQFWNEFIKGAALRPGDILCPQDAVGAGWTSIDNLDAWFGAYRDALAQRPDVHLWANNENFVQSDWSSATLDRFVRQLQITSIYAEQHVTFAYSHYYSPQNIHGGFHDAYQHYKQSGTLPVATLSAPHDLTVKSSVNYTQVISWEYSDNEEAVAGYTLFRDGEPIGSLKRQRKDQKTFIPTLLKTFSDAYMTNTCATYGVEAFDFTGAVSKRAEILYHQ